VLTFQYVVTVASEATGVVSLVYLDTSGRCLITAEAANRVTVLSPLNWTGDVTPRSVIGWLAGLDADILPGQTRSGFAVSADGVIGLCPFQLRPSLDSTKLGVAPPELEGDLPAYEAKVEAVVRTLSAIGTTIGPVPSPAVFEAVNFLDSLIADKETASTLGWIGTGGIMRSLDAKLNAARAALARGDKVAAANDLKALLLEVDAQAGKQISPEAAALLKFNTEYLIGKL
jgi:hypothetical protein